MRTPRAIRWSWAQSLAVGCALTASLGAATPPPVDNSLLADGPAMVREWTPATFPPEALNEKIRGRALVRIIVDENGRVTKARVTTATDPRLGEAAQAAVQTWVFTPATEERKPIAICMDVPFEFDPAKPSPKKTLLPPMHLAPRPVKKTAADIKSAWIDDYPETLRVRKLAGRVFFECEITPEGRAGAVRVLGATHADFIQAALATSPRWEFTPAMQGDLPVPGRVRGEVSISPPRTTTVATLAANGITALDGSAPEQPPKPEIITDPVWPHAHLLRGESGTATAEFAVRPDGTVINVKIREATAPEFGRALVAALEASSFEKGFAGSSETPVVLLKRAEFKAPPLDATTAPADDPQARLVILARKSPLPGGGDLDERLTPLYRIAPVYPAALAGDEKPTGQAVIEFVIDRDGRARLPRIVSATREEFGWAAATAVAQWLFRAPRRGGAATEVKVQIPIQF